MRTSPAAFSALLTAVSLFIASAYAAPAATPASTRKVVLDKAEKGYRWKLIEAPVPQVGDNQVLVHVRAVALNRGDWEILEQTRRDVSGVVAASDAAGDIIAVGSKVKGLRTGMRVTSLYFKDWTDGVASGEKLRQSLGSDVDGVLGDYIVLDETTVVPAPEGLSYEEAATLPTAGVTGWMATAGTGVLRKGDVVVVQGTGGVSVFALQFAVASGARVIVTSSSDDKLRRAAALGAKDGINYRTVPAWSERVMELTDKHGADLIVDVGGKDTLGESVKSLAYGGSISIVGGLTGYDGNISALGLLMKTATARGIFVGSRADYLRMSDFIVRNKLHPVIDRVFPLDQYNDALQYMASSGFVGKVVLRL